MAFCSDSRKTRRRGYSSGEEDALIQNQSKIITYGVHHRCASGVRISLLQPFVFLVGRNFFFIIYRRAEC
jgi:hypothetical protein